MTNNNLPAQSPFSQFFSNLFGVIAGVNIPFGSSDFAPLDSNNNIARLTGQDSVQWLGLKNRMMQKWAYDYCFPLASVIDRLAEYDTAGYVEIKRAKGKGAGNDLNNDWAQRLQKLMEQPNPLQTWDQFRAQQVAYKRTYGYCPVLPMRPAGIDDATYSSCMINIPPWAMEVDATGKLIGTEISDYVRQFRVSILGEYLTIAPEDLMILKDGFVQDEMQRYIMPKSKLVGLDMAVSNLCAAMEADNVLLRKRGSIGFISHDTGAAKDSVAGALPMTKQQQKTLQRDFQRYGISWNQFQYVISRVPAKWNSTVFDVKQLGTKETIVTAEKAICHRFGFPYTLYEQQDATYANAGNAMKSVYQDNIIPSNAKDMKEYARFFGADENNALITGCYDDVAAFQEDRQYKGNADKAQNEALQIEWLNNVITLNQWREARGYDTTPDGDIYYKDTKQEEDGNNVQQGEEARGGSSSNGKAHRYTIGRGKQLAAAELRIGVPTSNGNVC